MTEMGRTAADPLILNEGLLTASAFSKAVRRLATMCCQ